MPPTVLILGAGINGAALARELALNGVGVVIVDRHDIASGATAYSSRLIHGGLRYLEYGDFALVRESLGERTRLLRLAPQFVRPLRLFIPVQNRFGGLMAAARRFLGLKGRPPRQLKPGEQPKALHRGLWTVRFGLWLYDNYARDPTLPKHQSHRAGAADVVPVDAHTYPWVCSFSDAQVVFPERFTLALLHDARQIAAGQGTEFRVLTYHEATLEGKTVAIHRIGESQNPLPLGEGKVRVQENQRRHPNPDPPPEGEGGGFPPASVVQEFQPAAIVNATGAWVDLTNQALGIAAKRMMGGTKGSHFVTSNSRLQQLLAGRAVYTEASDSRPIFILPFVYGTLVGTTDEPFTGDPATALATPGELEYLVAAVNEVFPDLQLTTADIDMHYAGVRPLPFSDASTPGAVSRRHWMEEHPGTAVPYYSIIGGKLTTCRSLAEESAKVILKQLGLPHIANSEERAIPEMQHALIAARGTLGVQAGSNDTSSA
ncbi:MAG TPA: FAD-dependent oxidoreductase, partial [Pirellulales bacterium]